MSPSAPSTTRLGWMSRLTRVPRGACPPGTSQTGLYPTVTEHWMSVLCAPMGPLLLPVPSSWEAVKPTSSMKRWSLMPSNSIATSSGAQAYPKPNPMQKRKSIDGHGDCSSRPISWIMQTKVKALLLNLLISQMPLPRLASAEKRMTLACAALRLRGRKNRAFSPETRPKSEACLLREILTPQSSTDPFFLLIPSANRRSPCFHAEAPTLMATSRWFYMMLLHQRKWNLSMVKGKSVVKTAPCRMLPERALLRVAHSFCQEREKASASLTPEKEEEPMDQENCKAPPKEGNLWEILLRSWLSLTQIWGEMLLIGVAQV